MKVYKKRKEKKYLIVDNTDSREVILTRDINTLSDIYKAKWVAVNYDNLLDLEGYSPITKEASSLRMLKHLVTKYLIATGSNTDNIPRWYLESYKKMKAEEIRL